MNIRTLIILLSLPAPGLLGAARDIQFKSIKVHQLRDQRGGNAQLGHHFAEPRRLALLHSR